jgi:hypothetical protein
LRLAISRSATRTDSGVNDLWRSAKLAGGSRCGRRGAPPTPLACSFRCTASTSGFHMTFEVFGRSRGDDILQME